MESVRVRSGKKICLPRLIGNRKKYIMKYIINGMHAHLYVYCAPIVSADDIMNHVLKAPAAARLQVCLRCDCATATTQPTAFRMVSPTVFW